MKRSEASPDVLDVMQALWALAHALEARSKRMHRDLGITGPQRLLLRVVGQSPGCGPGEAARRLSLDPGTVTRLAAGLERRDLIRREVDPVDARRQRLVLTPRGKILNGRHRGTVEGAVREALAAASAGEVRQARRFIRRLTASLAVPRP
ncbi:MAG TPA: MarR family transcriptional regulator [Anaeromyxobacteraceae bacterium]|nr:MarR family transcriptional regulator [Anaeromyxobacteraceae bacterium]